MEADSKSPAIELEDDSAIAAIRSGDTSLIERFVRQHMGWMLAVANRIVRDSHLSEDAVQNAFAKIFKNIDSFNRQSALKTWMHRIVVNEGLMLIRKSGPVETVQIDELLPDFDKNGCRIEEPWSTMETPESLVLRADTRAQVNEKIGLLPDNYRIILVLRDIEELTTQEVAQLLELSEANVKVRLHRARAALKRLLEPMIRGQSE